MSKQSMEAVYAEFSRALHARLDTTEGCPRGWGRATWLSHALKAIGLKISVQGVQKWLDGAALPGQKNAVLLGRLLHVDASALLDGRIVLKLGNPGDDLAAALADIWPLMPESAKAELIEFAAFKAGIAPHKQDQKPTPPESPSGGVPIAKKAIAFDEPA